MRVTICGPNLQDQSKGQFHIHAAGCADLKRHAHREPEYRHGWTISAASQLDVAAEVYSDIMAEHEGADDGLDKPEAYVSEFHFFPCTKELSA